GELALYLRDGQADGPGGAGRAWDDVDRRTAATLPVLLRRAIDRLLRGGVAVHRGHQAFFDAEAFLEQHVHDGSQTVRGATGVGNDVMLADVVPLVIDTHDDGDIFSLRRRRDDDLLGARGQVSLGLLRLGKQAGCFDDIVHTKLLPWQGGGAFLHRQALD